MNINWINYGHTGNSRRAVSDVLHIVNDYLERINVDAAPYEGIASAFANAELVSKKGGRYVFTGLMTPARRRDLSLLPEMLANLADEMEETWTGLTLMEELLVPFRGLSKRGDITPNLDPDKLRQAKIFLERIA
jgi:uncharacterized protein Yka (UPF0111/DUF47 family)